MQVKKVFLSILIFIILISTVIPCFSFSENYTWSVLNNGTLDSSIPTSSLVAENTEINNENPLNLEAGSAILIEQNTGQILYGYNIHEKLHPASVTKIMSLLLIMEALDSGKITLDTQIPCSSNAASMGRFSNMVRYNRNFKC